MVRDPNRPTPLRNFQPFIDNNMKYLTVFASVLALATAQQFSQPNAERGVTDEEGKFEFNKEFLYNVNEDLSDKFGSFNAQGAVDNFFNFTSAAVTPLGQVGT